MIMALKKQRRINKLYAKNAPVFLKINHVFIVYMLFQMVKTMSEIQKTYLTESLQ